MSKELIQSAKKGNLLALNELIESHKAMAYSIAFKYLKNKEDAEDVIQNAFVIVLKSIKNFRNESKFSTWFYKVIYHECLKALKSKKLTVEYIPQFVKIDTQLEEDQENIKINDLLAHLKPHEYTVISLFYLKEKSIAEISKITAFSKSNIKVILHRSRTKLKQMYITKNNNYE